MTPPETPRREPMPFSPRFVPAILAGTKTVTRRFRPRVLGQWLRAKTPVEGRLPRAWPGFADLEVVDCRSVRLQDITEDEAHLEGLPSVYEFRKVWEELYPSPGTRNRLPRPHECWERNPPVWRIQFVCHTPTPAKMHVLEVD